MSPGHHILTILIVRTNPREARVLEVQSNTQKVKCDTFHLHRTVAQMIYSRTCVSADIFRRPPRSQIQRTKGLHGQQSRDWAPLTITNSQLTTNNIKFDKDQSSAILSTVRSSLSRSCKHRDWHIRRLSSVVYKCRLCLVLCHRAANLCTKTLGKVSC